MSWAAIVSGKARHSSAHSSPIVTASATSALTLDASIFASQRNPHIPLPTQSPLPASTSLSPQHELVEPDTSSTESAPSSCPSHSKSPPSQQSSDDNSFSHEEEISPDATTAASSDVHAITPSNQNGSHHQRNRDSKPKNHKKNHHQYSQADSPRSKHHTTSAPHMSPHKRNQKHKNRNQSIWDDPRIVAIYRLWTQHISNFMAQPVGFFHVFVMNPRFQQSVFDAGLTFHPDTDPTNPVLINLNSSRFGMAERISALSPPTGLDARSASTRPLSPPSATHGSQQLSPLSESAQPALLPPPSPGFLTPNGTNYMETMNIPHGLGADGMYQQENFANGIYSFDNNDPYANLDTNGFFEEALNAQFAEGMRLDVSDSESERMSEGDAYFGNATKLQGSFLFENARPISNPVRRRNGRSRVVSRVLDIRIPSQPICKEQSDKSKVEFIEQIGEIFPRITPPADYSNVREDLLKRLRKIISDEWNGAGIDVYGSAGNGLGLRSADVDMSLYMPDDVAATYGHEKGKPDPPKVILGRLAAMMNENDMTVLSKLFDARVPVIKMQDPVSKLQVDVCVNNALAVRNTELLKAYVDLDERFRYVCILVKLWAKKRELNDAYNGTLSSYAYTLLVIHYMQVMDQPVLPCLQRMVNGKEVSSDEEIPKDMVDNGNQKFFNTYFDRTVTPKTYESPNTQPVHELLMGFFRYYAYTFKYRTDLASIRLGVKTPRSARDWDESKVYAEWEAKQAQYKTQLEAARAALDAKRKLDSKDEKSKANNTDTAPTSKKGVSAKEERVQFPRRPRLASKHLFCIEDPFDIDHDLSRGMEKAAVSVIRQEMMRAYELIAETGDYELVCEDFR